MAAITVGNLFGVDQLSGAVWQYVPPDMVMVGSEGGVQPPTTGLMPAPAMVTPHLGTPILDPTPMGLPVGWYVVVPNPASASTISLQHITGGAGSPAQFDGYYIPLTFT